ncbi:MAG: hypothetical protein DI538_09040 [Azospira oryzae]|nr:MAG: hypothetical protein DI538_09040 [Azospira oryzae]
MDTFRKAATPNLPYYPIERVFLIGILTGKRNATINISTSMIRNYLLIALRNLKNNIQFTVLNVLGLSVGIACSLVIGLFVFDQYQYDTHHEKAERIYRVVNKQVEGVKWSYSALTSGVLATEIKRNFPEVEAATRVYFIHENIRAGNEEAQPDKIMAVDSSFFSIFSVTFKNKPGKLLLSGNRILLSESGAKKLFGDRNPMGELIMVGEEAFIVNGVYQDFPTQTHLFSNYIISFSRIEKTDRHANSWAFNSYYNYVLLPEGTAIAGFNTKLNTFIHRFTPPSWKSFVFFVQPLSDIHLQGGYAGNPGGSVPKVIMIGFSMVGLIILMLACFNYMNLATARSAKRALEVGVRKVMGAYRAQLIGQFLTESLLLCTAGFLLAILWTDLGIQLFNTFTGFKISINTLFTVKGLICLVAANLLLTFLAGSYPSFFLSRFLPAAVLKGQRSHDASRRLRKGIVLVQFSLTSLLVLLVIVVFKQTLFLRSQDLGFNKEQLLLFNAERNENITVESFKEEFLKIQGVTMITSTSDLPGWSLNTTDWRSAAGTMEDNVKIQWLFADHQYIPTLELKLQAGRNFTSNGNDENRGVIINEKAAGAMGWKAEEAIGKRVVGFIFNDSLPGEIIGVVKDFHAVSLKEEIQPLVIGYGKEQSSYVLRTDSDHLFDVREKVNKLGRQLTKDAGNFEAVFMEDALERIYQSETKVGQVLSFFTLLALLIGCSGLYALSAYEGEQRLKELGIRKIMGATTIQLLVLVSKSFVKLILIAMFISIPLGYFLGNIWLSSYAYRISWSVGLFAQSGICILLIGWLTIASQGLKAARLNPVNTLKND